MLVSFPAQVLQLGHAPRIIFDDKSRKVRKMKFANRVTITSALPYINGIKHLGNLAGSILPADVFHRFLNLLGVENIFICGTDDHGTSAEIAAAIENMSVEDYTAKYYELQKENYKQWCFDFTHFGRTHTDAHTELTQSFFTNMKKNGYIIEQSITLPYCKKCKKYLSDRYIAGTCPQCGKEAKGDQCEHCSRVLDPTELVNPYCHICKSKEIEFKKEEHLFMDFTKLQPKLEEWISSKKDWPTNTINFAKAWLKEGLKPRDVTRNLKWGIPVPGRSDLVFYVWFDAPIGYISITKSAVNDWEKWWSKKYEKDIGIVHFLGKDNIPFHTIFWPGEIIADGRFALPSYVQGYEYLNWEGGKFSTSNHIGIFADEALKMFPVDYWRFYLCRILPENKDSSFDWKDFQEKINAELNDNYGNLFYRIVSFIEKNFEGMIPKPSVMENDEKMLISLHMHATKIHSFVESIKLKDALSEIMILSSELNAYVQENAPWALLKTDKERCATVLYIAANVLRSITVLLWPYIPSTSEKALALLGATDKTWKNVDSQLLKPGHKIKSEILFKKITNEELEKLLHTAVDPELRVAVIDDVVEHPKADKLYVLQLKIGNRKRTIVAGLREFYTKEQLKGRQIVVVANMEPATLRGVRSEGMLLAAEDGTLVVPAEKQSSGSLIFGQENSENLSYDDFKKHIIVVRDGFVYLDGKRLPLKTDKSVEDGTKIV